MPAASSTPLTVLLPTRNRSELLRRVLGYCGDVGFPYLLKIGEASDGLAFHKNQEILRAAGRRLRLEVVRQSGDMIPCLLELLEQARTPYVLLAGDDDFFVPDRVEQCIRFLDRNGDYNVACGDVLSIYTHFLTSGRLSLNYSFRDPVRDIADAAPSRRLIRFYCPQTINTTYCIQRTEPIRHILRRSVECQLYRPQNALSEGALTSYSLIRGKFKHLPGLYHVRLRHRDFHVSKRHIQDHDYGLFIHQEITQEGWADKLKRFIEIVSEELVRNEEIDRREAAHVAETVFLGWFAPRLTRNRDRLLAKVRPLSGRRPWRNLLGRIPGLEAVWERSRPFRTHALSLEAAMNPRSPYHRDFLPIYRALKEWPVPEEDSFAGECSEGRLNVGAGGGAG